MSRPWFELDGERLIPTGVGVGPVPGTQHGSVVAAVIARAIEATPSPVPMDIVRMTVDLSRPVPFGVTETRVEVRRAGRRLQAVDVHLLVDGIECGRSEGMRIRRGEVIDPSEVPPDVPPVFDPSTHLHDHPWTASSFVQTLDITYEQFTPGHGAYWVRVREQMIAGETMSPTVRAAVAADMSMTGGSAFPRHSSLNSDLTMSLHRVPVGEWFRIESKVFANPGGWGTSIGTVADIQGAFCHVAKSVLYEVLPPNSQG